MTDFQKLVFHGHKDMAKTLLHSEALKHQEKMQKYLHPCSVSN